MFQMLGVFSEFERAMIVERVRSGIAKAKANGTRSGKPIGRPPVPEAKRQKIREAYKAGEGSMRELAARFGVSLSVVQQSLERKA
jgi:DNA invertase Pin-like site-specific DNA recombinase